MPLRERPGSIPGDVFERLRAMPRRKRRQVLRGRGEMQLSKRQPVLPETREAPPNHPRKAKVDAARQR